MSIVSLVTLEANFTGLSIGPQVNGYVASGGAQGPGTANAVPLSRLSVPWNRTPASDRIIDLLNWRVALSEFEGRDDELADLVSWAEDDRKILGKFVIGEGGTGKTRLAAEFSDTLRNMGWAAGFVRLSEAFSVQTHKEGTLLIVDYPEEHQAGLRTLLDELASNDNPDARIRVLFLTRHSIDRWEAAFGASGIAPAFDWSQPLHLDSLDPQPASVVFNTAVHKGMNLLGTKATSGNPPFVTPTIMQEWLVQAPEHGRALFVAAAALLSALEPDELAVRCTATEVVTDLVERERRRLDEASRNLGLEPQALAHLRTLATLNNRIDRTIFVTLPEELHLAVARDPGGWNKVISAGLVRDGFLEPQTPDIIGACLLSAVRRNELTSETFHSWLRFSALANGRDAIESLLRLSYDAHSVLGLPQSLFLDDLADAVTGQVSSCLAIHEAIEELEAEWQSTPPLLGTLAVVVGQMATKHIHDDEPLAGVLNNLSNRLDAVGETGPALETIRRAVEIRERLAKDQPARFEPDLAMSCGAYGTILKNAGERNAAVAAFMQGAALLEPYTAGQSESHPAVRLRQALLNDAERTAKDEG
jgi:hypothetical protein